MSFASLTKNQLRILICVVLASATLVLYLPVTRHNFINIDDQRFVIENPHVRDGLTWPGIVWAFQTTQTENWHPLTWITHMMDCQFYGLNPAGHHLTNLLVHIANTLLLFLLLNKLTGAIWRSFIVAALFAWHPLHVESVAWIAERKDVLSAFFWMLTLLTYTRYAQERSKADYFLALFYFTCGLMSKPMVVTLPFVLLLLDFWPLQRFQVESSGFGVQSSMAVKLICEKIPFFALAIAASIVTFFAQKTGEELMPLADAPLSLRIDNSLLAYAGYLSKIFCPVNLAVFYPYSYSTGWLVGFGCALLLILCTGLFVWHARGQPYLLVGWLWFLGTLVPTIGIVQVGLQSMADRYTYLPSIGILILAVWGVNDLLNSHPQKIKIAAVAGSIVFAVCLAITSIQIGYWQNSITLARHAIEVTENNYVAYDSIGRALTERGQVDEALPFFEEAARVGPHYLQSQINLAFVLQSKNRQAEAIKYWERAVQLSPNDPGWRCDFGMALVQDGRLEDAADQFNKVIRLHPDFFMAHYDLASDLFKQGKTAEAVAQYRETLRLQPDFSDALNQIAWILSTNPDPKLGSSREAVQFSKRACEISQFKQPGCLTTLSAAYAQAGQFSAAIATAQKARALASATGDKETVATDDKLLKLFLSSQTVPASF
ncbi:MAG TPA: tetratricopeptide repeat protein [Verrucomicrobiae bacterium]